MSDIPYSVRGSVTSVNKLRGFNFDTIEDNEMFKKVDANNVGGTKLISSKTADSNVLRMFVDNGPFEVLGGLIEAQTIGGVQKLHLNNTGDKEDGITITSNKLVGIGTFNPVEKLEVNGAIKIDSAGVASLKFNNTTAGNIADIDAIVDGTGGTWGVRTKVDGGGGSLTEKLRINNIGAIGIGGATYGTEGDVITSNGSGSSVSWRTTVVLGASLTNSSYPGANPRSVVLYDYVEYETVSCYDPLTGIFTAPRAAHYMVNAYARVTDFASPFASRAQSFIYKKVGGTFTKYSATDLVDTQENYKAGTPNTNIIIYLLQDEEIRHEVAFPGNTGSGYAIRGDAFEERCSYLSIHSIN